ncbi:MAG: GMC family oxidoreductase N-terminal domain-containing protein [Pseudomonadota bacterium]
MVIAVKPTNELAPSYDAIVVGSGYGGGVSASRLARMGLRVAVIEQGRLWRPGDFPTTIRSRRKQMRLTGRIPTTGDPSGLYSLSVGKGLTVFAATGLGGSSLINAGVTLRPDFSRLRNFGWPDPVLDDGKFEKAFDRAEAMLTPKSAPKPERFSKFRGMKSLADASERDVTAPPMTIAHQPGRNPSGVMQYACRYCGDCWSGCNVGAKNTVGITYIPDAVDHGADVVCEARVDQIAKADDGSWEVLVQDLAGSNSQRWIKAQNLVLAAGSLGTTELLLRAQKRGLALSDRLGKGFSANGDDMVFVTELAEPVHAVATGYPSQAPRKVPLVGPHSMALIDAGDPGAPVWVHDGTMLTVMASLAPLKAMLEFRPGRLMRLARGGRYGDELARTQVYYIVSQDDGAGELKLQRDRVVVDWPDYSKAPARVEAERRVRDMVGAQGQGQFMTNPFAMSAFGGNRIIAHPLGGAGMGVTASNGVVAHDGRVFDPSGGQGAVHEGLYVLCSAAVPTSIGVSPLLSITALAERAMMLKAERMGRTLDVATAPAKRPERDAAM